MKIGDVTLVDGLGGCADGRPSRTTPAALPAEEVANQLVKGNAPEHPHDDGEPDQLPPVRPPGARGVITRVGFVSWHRRGHVPERISTVQGSHEEESREE